MAFNNIFSPKKQKNTPELFLAVEIHESMIKSAVWQVEDETPSIVALGSYELWDTEDSLINGVDASLTEAIRGIDTEPDRVIFGLPDSWLVENRIHPTKQKLIKRLIKELDLKAIGMVTITEAIISHLKTQEGVPPTVILLEIYPSKVIVSLVNLGEIQAQEEVGRSDDLARDVEEGLARFEAEKLPARFVLTNGGDLENEEQQIIGYSWTEKLPFIHLPKVQVLPIDFSIRAIALSGGSEAAKAIGLEIALENVTPTPAEGKSDAIVEGATSDLASIGFSLDREVEKIEEVREEVEETVSIVEPEPVVKKLPHFALPKIKIPHFAFPSLKLKGLAIILPLIAFFLLVGGLIAYYFFFGKVKVVMSIAPVRVNQTIDVSIGTGTKDNYLSVIATKKTLSAKASDSLPTTGEALVGDKATGKVIVYTTKAINLKAGSKITAPDGQTFTLDTAVSVASGSADPSSPATVSVSVLATKIGADSNLEKGIKLTADGHQKSDIVAVVDATFSGGSSRTVKAVDKKDQDKLLTQVSDKIKAAIDDQLKASDPDSRSIVVGALKYTTKTFDHTIGQEANTLYLDLAADMDVLVYSKKEMLSQIEKKILASVDLGLVFDSEQTQVSFTDPTPLDANTFATKANVQAVLFPKINETEFTKVVRGKPISALKNILQTTPGYQSATVYVSPKLPLLDQFLPLNSAGYSYRLATQ